MNAKDSFSILRISPDATLSEAKNAYKRLVKLWHPDQYVHSPEKQMIAQEKLKEINVAYRDIIALFKHNPVRPDTFPGINDAPPHQKDIHQDNENKRKTLWHQVSHFFRVNILKSNRSVSPEKESPLSHDATRNNGVALGERNVRMTPDFQKILKRAVNEKRAGLDSRQRDKDLKRVRKQDNNLSSNRIQTAAKRSHGDRVEKIAPIGRVNRIGGD